MPLDFETDDADVEEFTLTDALQSPKRMRTDEGTVEERSIDEMIKGDRYAAAKVASALGPPWGLQIARAAGTSTTS